MPRKKYHSEDDKVETSSNLIIRVPFFSPLTRQPKNMARMTIPLMAIPRPET